MTVDGISVQTGELSRQVVEGRRAIETGINQLIAPTGATATISEGSPVVGGHIEINAGTLDAIREARAALEGTYEAVTAPVLVGVNAYGMALKLRDGQQPPTANNPYSSLLA